MIHQKKKKYPVFIRILHWLMAFLILGLIAVGWYMHQLPEDAANKYVLYGWHKSFGMLVLFLWPIRTIAKAVARRPAYYGLSDKQIRNAAIGHGLLYFLILLVPVSGYMMSSAGGYGVQIFGIKLPDVFGENKDLAGFAHVIHEYAPWVLLAVVAGHVFAVVYHHSCHRINILKRML